MVADAALNALHLQFLGIHSSFNVAYDHPDAPVLQAEALRAIDKLKWHPSITKLEFTGNVSVDGQTRDMLAMKNSRVVKNLCLLIHAQVSGRSSKKGKLLPVDTLRLLKDYIGRSVYYPWVNNFSWTGLSWTGH
jgi:hypothetical protein